MFKRNGNGGSAFDAATSSSLAFLSSELEFASPDLVKPLTSSTHPRDITMTFGGGFVEFLSAYASDYASVGLNEYGLQGTSNTDIPQVQVAVNKGVWNAWNWASSILVTQIDLKRLETAKRSGIPAPFSLQQLLEDGIQLVWNKALEKVTYLGWLGQPGLINASNVTSALAPATGSGSLRTWASKTPAQIQLDINAGLTATVTNSGYSLDGMADRMLIPWTEYQLLMQPMTTGGFSSILEFLMQNNIARQNGIDFKIFPVANPWISGQGTGTTDRAVFYRNNEKNVLIRVPQPVTKAMMVPSADKGGAYETIYNGCIGQVQILRSSTMYYLDGIG